jgi:hypothetical protein
VESRVLGPLGAVADRPRGGFDEAEKLLEWIEERAVARPGVGARLRGTRRRKQAPAA